MQLLTRKQTEIIQEERSMLSKISAFLSSIQGEKADVLLIEDTLDQLDELFLIVIAGEYNSGKTAFINALLGGPYLETGITPTTDSITLLYYKDEKEEAFIEPGKISVALPVPMLKELRIVDTPGTNAILREHESLTTDFIPRSDIVIFVTSVDRPFTESERAFLEKIRQWGKKIVFVINKIDIVDSSKDIEEVEKFVIDNARKLLDSDPVVFKLSAKDALIDVENQFKNKNLEEIEKYILTTLDKSERVRIKLNNPMHILERITTKYDEINRSNIELMKDDMRLLGDIKQQLSLFHEDSLRRFIFRYADIDNALMEFEKRGISFFDETFRIGRILDLINKERIQREYKDNVVKDLSQVIDSKVDDLIEWLVDENYKQWQIVNGKINQRMSAFEDRILHDTRSNEIQIERKKIISDVKRQAQRVIEKFNRNTEAHQIADDAQMAVAASAAIEVGALGLGTLVSILATTASADLTGVLLAGLTATLGFFIIPTKKKQVKKKFSEKILSIRNQLSASLQEEINHQLNIVIDNIQGTIAPYKRFIDTEDSKLKEISIYFENLKTNIHKLRKEISKFK